MAQPNYELRNLISLALRCDPVGGRARRSLGAPAGNSRVWDYISRKKKAFSYSTRAALLAVDRAGQAARYVLGGSSDAALRNARSS